MLNETSNIKGPFIETYHGFLVDILHPDPSTIWLRDIVHHLSGLNRFCGGGNRRYSVLEHSIRLSWIVPEHLKLAALLHDASEAYLGDMPSPVKHLCNDYKNIESGLMYTICNKYGVQLQYLIDVHKYDKMMVSWEKKLLYQSKNKWSSSEQEDINYVDSFLLNQIFADESNEGWQGTFAFMMKKHFNMDVNSQ